MRVIHCADLHLGRQRLNGRLPDADFAAALGQIVARAIEWKAEAFLIAGDLFDSPQIPPPVLRQASAALAPLKKARIPVLAIEGNHDRPGLASTAPTWTRYLAEEGLLRLLSTPFTAEGPRMDPYDPATGQGAWIELGGIRFVGAGYLGAGTDRKVQAIAAALPENGPPTVLLLHAGPEYFLGETGGFSRETLALLRSKVLYIALGHIHRPMIHRDEAGRPWALNPGSPENCRLEEAAQAGPRGWAEVVIDPEALPELRLLHAEIRETARRPVARLDLDIAPFGNKLKEGAEAIAVAALKLLAAQALPPQTVVRLHLNGELNIGRIAVDPPALGQRLAESAKLAAVEVLLDGVRLYTGRSGAPRLAGPMTAAQIERLALEEILRLRPPEGWEERLSEVAQFCAELRDLVAHGATAEAILEFAERAPLADAAVPVPVEVRTD